MDLVLFGAAGGCSRVTMTALEETGAPFSYEIVRFMTQENTSPAFLAKNPHGKIPCLVVDGRPLRENAAILLWLNETFPAAKLLPPVSDALEKAEQMADLCFCSATLHPILTRISVPSKFGPPEASASIQASAENDMHRYFAVAEEHLTNRNYWYGDDWSVMDAYLGWIYRRMDDDDLRRLCGSTSPFDLTKYPFFSAMMDRQALRPSVQRVVAREAEENAQMEREGLSWDAESFDADSKK